MWKKCLAKKVWTSPCERICIPCQNDGICINQVASFSCRCRNGYKGDLCEININECNNINCHNGTCHDLDNNFECICDVGYEGKFCEIDADDCASNPCQGESNYCYDLPNDYRCECQTGYEGKSCEKNIDEFFYEFFDDIFLQMF